jgi:hypothetical protein
MKTFFLMLAVMVSASFASAQDTYFRRPTAVPAEIKPIAENVELGSADLPGYRKMTAEYCVTKNPGIDSSSIEFKTLAGVIADRALNGNGKISIEDFNKCADHFNNSRLISKYINATKLPPLFKDELRKYYSEELIVKGIDKDAGDEMNWLNWIPSGGTVVFVDNGNPSDVPKGALISKNNSLEDIIATVYPQFVKFSEEARDRALIFTGKINPKVSVTGTKEEGNLAYTAEQGRLILVPLLKFISE